MDLPTPLPPEFNFRDVGGLRTQDGGRVRRGKLFRSAAPQKLEPGAFLHVAEEHQLTTVVDLRSAEEIAGANLSAGLPEGLRRSIPLFPTIHQSWVNPKQVDPTATARRYLEMLEVGMPSIRQIVELLGAEPDGATLLHCAAGRDRTGIVIAVLLSLVRVDLEQIAEDYGRSDLVVGDGFRALPETIARLFERINSQYGSVASLAALHGIAEQQIAGLRMALVEDRE